MRQCISVLVLYLCLAAMVSAHAVSSGWRTDGTGRFPAAFVPTLWAQDQHIVWATPLEHWSNACQILVGDRIVICAEPSTLICLNTVDGRMRWQRANAYEDMLSLTEQAQLAEERAKVAELARQMRPLSARLRSNERELKKTPEDEALKTTIATLKGQIAGLQQQIDTYALAKKWQMPPTEETNGYASSTPTSDGQYVYALFGNGIAVCYDLEGNLRWRRFLEKPTHVWGWCASPLLVGDMLIAQYNNAIYGLRAGTGETVWQGKASHQWGSPQYMRIGQYDAVVTASALLFNAANGAVLAKLPTKPLAYNSALAQDGLMYYVQPTSVAMRPVVDANGTVSIEEVWRVTIDTNPAERFYASPLVYDGLLYAVNQKGVLSVVEISSGALVYQQKLNLGGTAYPSPVLAGQVIILSSDNGKSVVIAPGRSYTELARNTLEGCRTTLTCEGKRMYLRGKQTMYCIGE